MDGIYTPFTCGCGRVVRRDEDLRVVRAGGGRERVCVECYEDSPDAQEARRGAD